MIMFSWVTLNPTHSNGSIWQSGNTWSLHKVFEPQELWTVSFLHWILAYVEVIK